MPNGIADLGDAIIAQHRLPAAIRSIVQRDHARRSRAVGRGPVDPGVPFPNRSHDARASRAINVVADQLRQPGPRRLFVRHHRSPHGILTIQWQHAVPARRGRRQLQRLRPVPAPATRGEVGDAGLLRRRRRLLLPVERMRRWVTPADINGTGAWCSGTSTPSGAASRRPRAPTSSAASSSPATSARPASRA